MSYIALYRKWRPLIFEDVVEQEHVVRTLKNSISTGRIAHAYLFCGTRGTGKTTMAKIFSRAINCTSPQGGNPCNECEICKSVLNGSNLDVIEIDAASNNSVDNVREIRDEVVYTPSQAKYKVYIIDEVHMLSTGAFNALLKTLEEPPSHVIFILATTEPHKLPATILSRCQRFDFRRIPIDSIVKRLTVISEASGATVQKEALRLVAKMSDGALRDAISILDQCIAIGKADISYEDVLGVVGIVNSTFIANIVDALLEKDIKKVLEQIEKLIMDGKDIGQFVSDLVLYFRNLLICKVTSKPEDIIDLSSEIMDIIKKQSTALREDVIVFVIKELSLLESSIKWSEHPRVLLEVSLIKICEGNNIQDTNSLLERINALEAKLNNPNLILSTAPQKNSSGAQGQNLNEGKKEAGATNSKPAAKVIFNENDYLDNWGSVMNELRNSGRMSLWSYLSDSRAIKLDNNVVGIIFTSNINKQVASRTENIEVLENIIGTKMGREIRVKCVTESELAGTSRTEKPKKDELIEKAEEIAKRLNTNLNIIDE